MEALRRKVDPAGKIDSRVVTVTDPTGAAAEQFRVLHLRLERARVSRPLAVVAVTSAVAGEGKSLTVACLAASSARRGRKTLLVDCDLRRPTQASLFGVDEGPGLGAVLAGRASIASVLRKGPGELALLPAGTLPEDVSALLSGPMLGRVLRELRDGYQEIYLDLPPALPFADAMLAAAAADGVLVVVRSGRTPAEKVAQAVEALAGAPLLGCVLTGDGEASQAYRRYWARR